MGRRVTVAVLMAGLLTSSLVLPASAADEARCPEGYSLQALGSSSFAVVGGLRAPDMLLGALAANGRWGWCVPPSYIVHPPKKPWLIPTCSRLAAKAARFAKRARKPGLAAPRVKRLMSKSARWRVKWAAKDCASSQETIEQRQVGAADYLFAGWFPMGIAGKYHTADGVEHVATWYPASSDFARGDVTFTAPGLPALVVSYWCSTPTCAYGTVHTSISLA